MKLTISDSKDRFVKDGKPFFLLADTVWDAFSNSTLSEWEDYLFVRKQQQFNALQMSVLPILPLYNPKGTYTGLYPFHRNPDGSWIFHSIDETYFDDAEAKVRLAVEKGFIPILALIWINYVPDTWANEESKAYTMPKDAVKPYVDYVMNRFKAYDPMYFISGDTRFETEVVEAYYADALEYAKAADPDALMALHIGGDIHELPERIYRSASLDVYVYQSGHMREGQRTCYQLADALANKSIKRPVFNSEPLYEGHGHGKEYGRFDAFDVRKSFWWSVLSGAKAGYTYGAHGMFSWFRKGDPWKQSDWSKVPFDWRMALHFQGAWDISYSKWLFDRYELQQLEPGNNRLPPPYEDIRIAAAQDLSRFAIYIPYSNDVAVDLDLSGYEVEMITLANRQVIRPDISFNEGRSMIRMTELNSDSLVIGWRKGTLP